MKEQFEQLIANDQIKEALELLSQHYNDGVLLQGRYNSAKRNFDMGLIDFDDYQRMLSQVRYSAFELLKTQKSSSAWASSPADPASSGQPTATWTPASGNGQNQTQTKRAAFISYNHGDGEVARQVRTFLENNGIDVIIDEDDLSAGDSIMEFIQDSIKNCNAVVSIISSKSLQSGWVGQESVSTIYAVWLADKKFLPVRLDSVAFDIDFQISAQENIQLKITDLETKIAKLRQLGGDSRAFDDDRNRLFELRNNLGQIIQRLKTVNSVDISGANFEPNMKKVLRRILDA